MLRSDGSGWLGIILTHAAFGHRLGASADVLRRGLDAQTRPARRKPYRAATFALGQPLLPSLDKSLAIASALEDEEIARKLQLRK